MTSGDGTVVRTELSEGEYERLRAVADEEECSIEAVLRRAAKAYVEAKSRPDPDGPFFAFHERVDVESAIGDATDARAMDEDLYGEES